MPCLVTSYDTMATYVNIGDWLLTTDPDQTRFVASDLGLHTLLGPLFCVITVHNLFCWAPNN